MAVAFLDINDSNLQLWHADKQWQSPGYALLDGNSYTFGNSARGAARLRPRQINTRFWWQLNTQALQPALGPARHTADLVHAHLLDIHKAGGQPEEILLAVSSSIGRDQLALILGIIEQCPFNAVGLVNRSVALASLYGGPGKLFHLEIQLHQTIISELLEANGQVELQRTIPIPGCGLLQLQERLVELIAAAFIRQTRFDPRRKAETEQLLYDALPTALMELQSAAETNLEVNGYRARIVRDELVAAGDRLFSSSADAMGILTPADRVILDPLANLLPGLQQNIPQTEFLGHDALPSALNLQLENLVQRNETLNFITALPSSSQQIAPLRNDNIPEQEAPAPVVKSTSPAPTHLLHGATAQSIEPSGVPIDATLELFGVDGRWLLRGELGKNVLVNGLEYHSGSTLNAGDTITSGSGTTAVLIAVVS
ncbi:MAG: hypothetical protein V7709_11850 [Halioglobus sp.]